MEGNQGYGMGASLTRFPAQPTNSSKATKQQQIQASLNMQHMYQMQKAKEHHKSSSGLYHTTKLASGKPPSYDTMLASSASTPSQATLQQRALTQLYQQTAATTLAASKTHSTAKHQYASASGAGTKLRGHHQSASSKKIDHQSTKQVDLQAKFATLLKQSKDMHKESSKFSSSAASLPGNHGGKQDKKGEKRDFDKAAAARNQLFGEVSKSGKESLAAKQAKESTNQQHQHQTMSPARHSSALRQTPTTQQMMIIQNQGGSPIAQRDYLHQKQQSMVQKTPQHQSSQPLMVTALSKTGLATKPVQKTQGAGYDNFANAALSSTMRHFNDHRDSTGRASGHQGGGPSGTRAASNSQTRSKKRSKAGTTTSALRQTFSVTQDVSNPHFGVPAMLESSARPGVGHRNSTVTTTTSTKSKKKKQQPSQSANMDPAEEYLANVARLQYQIQTLNNIPAAVQSATSNNTPAIANQQSSDHEQLNVQGALLSEGESNPERVQPAQEVACELGVGGFAGALSSANSQSMQALLSNGNNFGLKQGACEAAEHQSHVLLSQFKVKCQQEMQEQTKKALAKLLYTKREILLEIKAMQATVKQQQQQHPESARSQASSQAKKVAEQQQAQLNLYSQQNEIAMKEMIKEQQVKLEGSVRAQILESNERLEERIDDILLQIQGIVSGLEGSLNARIGKIDEDLTTVAEEVDSFTKDKKLTELATEAHQMATKGLESVAQLSDVVQGTYIERDAFDEQFQTLKLDFETKIQVAVADQETEFQKNLGEDQLRLIESKMRELQEAMDSEQELLHDQRVKEQEERLSHFQAELSQLVEHTLQEAWSDFEQLSTSVKDEVQMYISKELIAKEQKIESKMERSKQQFLKAVNGNMRVLDNLISDYTTRTRDQIKNQLRTGPSSRAQLSHRLHQSGQENDMLEELHSVHGSSPCHRSDQLMPHLSARQNPRNLDAVTAKSFQLAASLSSVQDVSDTIRQPPAEEELSSQLLSTARDRLLQQQVTNQQLQGVVAGNNSSVAHVPSLNINGIVPQLKHSSNSERQMNMAQNLINTTGADDKVSPSGKTLADYQDYSTPQKALLNSFHTAEEGHQQVDDEDDHQPMLPRSNSPQMIIVEEQKFTQSQEESSSVLYQQQHGVPSPEPLSQSHEIVVQRLPERPPPEQQSPSGVSHSSTYLEQRDHICEAAVAEMQASELENSHNQEINPPWGDAAEVEQDAPYEEEKKDFDFEGDIRERSLDFKKFQMASGNVLPMMMSKFPSEVTTIQAYSYAPSKQQSFRDLNNIDGDRVRNAATVVMTPHESIQQIQEEIDQEEQIDFALSNSPYQMRSGGQAGFGQSQDSNSIEGTMYNFGFNSLQGAQLPSRSHSLKQPKGAYDKGAISTRLKQVVSPMQQVLTSQLPLKTGTSMYKQENTDSEFWNLTADDDSQIDPVMVMRNLSNTNIFSGSTSIIQIQEADNKTSSRRASQTNTIKQSVGSSSPQPQLVESTVRHQACVMLERQNSSATSNEDPIEVQLIQNDAENGREALARRLQDSEQALIKDFTPVTSPPLDMQRSFQNSEDDHAAVSEAENVLHSEDRTASKAQKRSKRDQVVAPFASGKPQGFNEGASDEQSPLSECYGSSGPDDSDQKPQHASFLKYGSSHRQSANCQKPQPHFTKEQARRSAMVPMLEERVLPQHALAEAASSQGPSNARSANGSTQTYIRERKAGANLPAHLQRQGNEIIQNIYLDEVFAALKEVLSLRRDHLEGPFEMDLQNSSQSRDVLSESPRM